MRVDDSELYNVSGGGSVSGAFLNYLSTIFKTVYGIGQGLGGAIRRIASGKTCML